MDTHSGYQATCTHKITFNSITHKQTESCVLCIMHSNALNLLLMYQQAFTHAHKGPLRNKQTHSTATQNQNETSNTNNATKTQT